MSFVNKIKKAVGDTAVFMLSSQYLKYYRQCEIVKNRIFYTSHQGVGMVCSPYAVFDTFMHSDEFDSYEHIWQINDSAERDLLRREYSGCPNVKFIGKNGMEYFEALSSSEYIISNNTMPYYFIKKPEQIYVNTWHGIPLKTLGYDVPDGKFSTRNMTRNFLISDYIISPCRFTTHIFKDSFKMDGLFTGTITECGTPRNDMVVKSDKSYVISKLIERGAAIDEEKQIILYAPTWKGSSFVKAENDVARYDEFCGYLSEHIDTEKYQILIKPHPMVYKLLSDEERSSGRYVPPSVDTNELLSITDILISDYSSIFFDFLLTDRPIFFYIPDIDSYNEYRGMYFGLEQLPGPRSQDMGDIADWICEPQKSMEDYAGAYQSMKAWACEFDDGSASERIINAVFKKDCSECRALTGFDEGRKKILVAGGAFAKSAHTERIIDWLSRRDFEQNDITLMIDDESGMTDEISRVPDSVRVICKCKDVIKSLDEKFSLNKNCSSLSGDKLTALSSADAYALNYRRYFGDLQFDEVVNFADDAPEQAFTAYNGGQKCISSFEASADWILNYEAAQKALEVKKYE